MAVPKVDEVIVLDVKEMGEADLLVSFFSRQSGRLKGIAKHGKKSIKRFPNCFVPGNLLNLEYLVKPNRDLTFLLQGRLLRSPMHEIHELNLDSNTTLGMYCLKLTDISLPPSLPEPHIYQLLLSVLEQLKKVRDLRALCLFYETRLMKLLGYGMNLSECISCKRRYTFSGKAFFAPNKGGIYCQRCMPSSGTFAMEPFDMKILHDYQTLEISDLFPTDLEPIICEKLSSVIVSHMKQHISPIPAYLWEIRRKIFERS